MSYDDLFKNLEKARAIAAQISVMEESIKVKALQISQLIGVTPKTAPETVVPFKAFIQPLGPGYRHASKIEKARKFLQINPTQAFSARQIAEHIDEMPSLGSISSMISRMSTEPSEPIQKVSKGRFKYRDISQQ